MSEIVALLDELAIRFSTVESRAVVTFVAIAAMFVITWSGHAVRKRVGNEVRGAVIDLVITVVVALFVVSIVSILLGVWGLAGPVEAILAQSGIGVETLRHLLLTIGLLAVTYVLVGIIKRTIDEFVGHHDGVSQHQREITYRIIQVGIYTTAGIVVLGIWQVDLSGLLIGAGFLGIIVGLAARQTLSAILAGFVLMFSRPFEVGDWVLINDKEGIITDITVVNTRLQTFDGEYVVIPNDVVSSSQLTNRSQTGRLRLRVEVGIDYQADIERAIEVAQDAISDLEQILSVPTPQVIVTRFGDSAVFLELRFWIDKPSSRRRWQANQAVIKAVKIAFEREEIKIPFPQRELSGRDATGGFRVAFDQEVPSNNRDSGGQRGTVLRSIPSGLGDASLSAGETQESSDELDETEGTQGAGDRPTQKDGSDR